MKTGGSILGDDVRRAVFLDRDGVLNRAPVQDGHPGSPFSVDEVEILPGVLEACEKLRRHGFLLIVVTNQPNVARGIQKREAIEAIHGFLRDRIPLDDIRICFHDDGDNCECRKPKPGLVLAGAMDWRIELRQSFVVGDRWRDIEAGRRAGCKTVFINHRYAEEPPSEADFETNSLDAAADWILANEEERIRT
jgi:D-glycero-D-manno-heptose 1,7-bisphosphate phosphatase